MEKSFPKIRICLGTMKTVLTFPNISMCLGITETVRTFPKAKPESCSKWTKVVNWTSGW